MNPVQFYKCLADETRLSAVLLIQMEGELCVCELTQALGEIQPKISRHLALLRKSGLLTDRRQGQWVFYQINQELPDWAKQVIEETAYGAQSFLEQAKQALKQMSDRPLSERCSG